MVALKHYIAFICSLTLFAVEADENSWDSPECAGYEDALAPDPDFKDPKYTRDAWECREHYGCLLTSVCQYYNYDYHPKIGEIKAAAKTCIRTIKRIVPADDYEHLMNQRVSSWQNANNTIAHFVDCIPDPPSICSRIDIFFDFNSKSLFQLSFLDACFTMIYTCTEKQKAYMMDISLEKIFQKKITKHVHLSNIQEYIRNTFNETSFVPYSMVKNVLLYMWGGTIEDFLSCKVI